MRLITLASPGNQKKDSSYICSGLFLFYYSFVASASVSSGVTVDGSRSGVGVSVSFSDGSGLVSEISGAISDGFVSSFGGLLFASVSVSLEFGLSSSELSSEGLLLLLASGFANDNSCSSSWDFLLASLALTSAAESVSGGGGGVCWAVFLSGRG